jgi:hypothetical protein
VESSCQREETKVLLSKVESKNEHFIMDTGISSVSPSTVDVHWFFVLHVEDSGVW